MIKNLKTTFKQDVLLPLRDLHIRNLINVEFALFDKDQFNF